MPLSPREAQALADQAVAHLKGGDASSARAAFGRLAAEGVGDASIQLGLGYACEALGDLDGAIAAADAVLAREPRNVRALMLKGDSLDAQGAVTAATFYQAVLKCTQAPGQLAPELMPLAQRAQAQLQHYAERFESTLREHLARESARIGKLSPRFAQSLDLLVGRKQVYPPQPRLYHFPELPPIQFFERADFPWLDRVEAATDAIRAELLPLLREPASFAPYVQSDPARAALNRGGMLDNPEWSACFLWKNGRLVDEVAARCPRTLQALEGAPIVHVPGRSPSVLFSLLRPGARIPPHHGFVNTRLIVHLPLIVPPGCGFRVGNDTREWVEGKAWVFDDTIEHEAWNRSNETRVILLFETWRPELSESERTLVSTMLGSIEDGNDWET